MGSLLKDLHDGCLVAHVLLVHEVVGFGKESERLIGWRDVHEASANVVSVLLSDYAIVGEPLQIGKWGSSEESRRNRHRGERIPVAAPGG